MGENYPETEATNEGGAQSKPWKETQRRKKGAKEEDT